MKEKNINDDDIKIISNLKASFEDFFYKRYKTDFHLINFYEQLGISKKILLWAYDVNSFKGDFDFIIYFSFQVGYTPNEEINNKYIFRVV